MEGNWPPSRFLLVTFLALESRLMELDGTGMKTVEDL